MLSGRDLHGLRPSISMPLSPKYKLFIFDFDGTLADSLDDIAWCMEKTFVHFGEPPPGKPAVRALMSGPLETSLQQLREKKCSPKEIAEWVRFYRSVYNGERERQTRLFPGALDLLEQVTAEGIQSLVVSNKGSVAVEAELSRLGIRGRIGGIFAADVVAYPKPDSRLYHVEIKSSFSSFEDRDVLVIGDTEVDLRFAKNAGVASCWAAYGYGQREDCLGLKPDITIESLSELRSVLV
jgi:phosphoglycolate phosphatase